MKMVSYISMKIGIDFDGTLNQMDLARKEWILEHTGVELQRHQADGYIIKDFLANYLTDPEAEQCCAAMDGLYDLDATLQIPLAKGVTEVIPKLAISHGLHVVTARDPSQRDTVHEYLKYHGMGSYFEGISALGMYGTTKMQACQEIGIDVLVDDYKGNFDGSIPGILMRLSGMRDDDFGGHQAFDWYGVKSVLENGF